MVGLYTNEGSRLSGWPVQVSRPTLRSFEIKLASLLAM